MLTRACLTLILLMAAPLWCQVDTDRSEPAAPVEDTQMLTPPPVSGQNYPTAPASEQRSNYLRYGLTFSSAYSNNVQGGSNPTSDVSYSVWPTLALDHTTSRLRSVLSYSPGFTFYQRSSGLNEADHNLSISIQDRLSPHWTLSAGDNFLKSSSIFNQPDAGFAGSVSGGMQGSNFSVIAPLADMLHNSANVGVTYQFAANGMLGASGTFTNLHYLNSTQVQGLGDSTTQAGSVFYSLRASKMHYFGVSYQYQRLVSSSSAGRSETQTDAVFFYYTLYPKVGLSISFYAGPQYSDTVEAPVLFLQLPAAQAWHPALGGSFSWQGSVNSAAVSYSHVISGGGGLSGASRMESANASFQRQITRSFSAALSGGYTQNDVIGSPLFAGSNNGHTLSGTASLQKQFGEHVSLQLGYSRVHQNYSGVPVLASTPDTNREFVSVSYQFSRPLGR